MPTKKEVKINTETKENSSENKTTEETKEIRKDDKIKQENGLKKEEKEQTDDPLKEMEEKLESFKKEGKESHNRFLRVSAEFENYKKRATREMNDFRKFANESFIKAMLPVVDNLDRAIESSSNQENTNISVVEGVNMTLKEILKVFEEFRVKRFESLGKTFDPNFHQAVQQEETDEHPDNTVLRELQKGYMIHDRLLRPAMVVVSKAKIMSEEKESKSKKNENNKNNKDI